MQPEERKNSLIEQEFASRRFPSLKLRQELVCWIWKPATQNNRVWEPQDATLYPRPTFLWTNNLDVKKKVMSLGARVVDSWQDATCHVVEAFSNPGQRVSWSAKLNGHLIVTKDLAAGPWIQWLDWYLSGPCCATTPWTVSLYFKSKIEKNILMSISLCDLAWCNAHWSLSNAHCRFDWCMVLRYMAAGKIATQRNLLLHPELTELHPGLAEIMRCSLEGGWKIHETCQQVARWLS